MCSKKEAARLGGVSVEGLQPIWAFLEQETVPSWVPLDVIKILALLSA